MSITRIKFKIQCSSRTLFLNYSQDNFSKTTKDWHIMHKQCSCSHAKNDNLLKSVKPYIFKIDSQMWKLHRKLNFPNIFRLAAIYTWAPAFKCCRCCYWQYRSYKVQAHNLNRALTCSTPPHRYSNDFDVNR